MQQGSWVRPEDMQQGFRQDQRTCNKKNQHQGPMYVQISNKKAIKNPVKELGRDTQRLGILGTCSTTKVGLRQLKRGTTKYKKWRTDMSFSSTQWCSKEPENLESDNSWTKGWYLGKPRMKNYKGKWLGKLSTQQEWILLSWEKWKQEGQPKSWV